MVLQGACALFIVYQRAARYGYGVSYTVAQLASNPLRRLCIVIVHFYLLIPALCPLVGTFFTSVVIFILHGQCHYLPGESNRTKPR